MQANGGIADQLIRAAGSLTSSVIRGQRLLILCYHRVLPNPDPLLPDAIDRDDFEKHMSVLSRCYRPMPLHEATRRMYEGSLPRGSVCVTFDDGYADNYSVALPVLKKYGIPATLFVATGYLDGGRMWNDTVIESVRRASEDVLKLPEIGLPVLPLASIADREMAARKIVLALRRLPPGERADHTEALATAIGEELPDDLMLSSSQLAGMHESGVEVGAHTVTHPVLSRVPAEVAAREIADSKHRLRDILGSEVVGFAYPNGHPGIDFDKSHVRLVANCGFTYAVTTARGSCSASTDRFQLPRLDPWSREYFRFGLRVALEFTAPPSRLA